MNPYITMPKTTNQDVYRYKVMNKETKKLQTSLDKQHYIKKNELKTYQNEYLIDIRRLVNIPKEV